MVKKKAPKIAIPRELPSCLIIHELIKKTNQKQDIEFDYIAQLNALREIVSVHVSRINLLFPEYTPHDEKYHLKKLFYVADLLLGEELIHNMNATELFLLSASLYAHDWGMAISEDEKDKIVGSPFSPSEDLLDDENVRLELFCKNKNITPSSITIEDWREYIRNTHAFRSGKRVRSFFSSHPGIGDYCGRICEGHYLDFDVIDDYISYPTDCSILREVVNVKALTLYVRLIDLLDLGDDRTPFILWKFVAPRNKFSKMEWAKHRALQAVTCPPYQYGRYVQVDGSTDDHNVYMGIMDLKKYIDEQFRYCSDMLNRVNHEYHKLNISHIAWRVAARGFTPISIQFEFDRARMFDILSDEIYNGAPYVFLRELVQNAIDAISLRSELLEKNGVSLNNKGRINITVKETRDTYVVSIADNGIGMDEYIIRNYLAVAGRSYYKSPEFDKEGLKMDPISRFGVGVLSCFMVAEYVEIQTYRDPYISNTSKKLKIVIPSRESYFRIETASDTVEVGTTVTVYVLKDRLPQNEESNFTVYLKENIGFSKYPISIKENGEETVIYNPNQIADMCIKEGIKNFSLSYNYPIDNAILPQNKEAVLEYFQDEKYHLEHDLKLEHFDGCITYLVPKSDDYDIVYSGGSGDNDILLMNYSIKMQPEPRVKWNVSWDYLHGRNNPSNTSCKIYVNGIAMLNAPPFYFNSNDQDGDSDTTSTSAQVIINLKKSNDLKINLARTNFSTQEKWNEKIRQALAKLIIERKIDTIDNNDHKKLALLYGKFRTFYHFLPDTVLQNLKFKVKFPVLLNGPKLSFEEPESVSIKVFPQQFSQDILTFVTSEYKTYEDTKNEILSLWEGEKVIILGFGSGYATPISIVNMFDFFWTYLHRNYSLVEIEFVTSPLGPTFPIVQGIWHSKSTTEFRQVEFEHFPWIFTRLPQLVKFAPPFQTSLFFGFEYMNVDHPFTKAMLSAFYQLQEKLSENTIPKKLLGTIEDTLSSNPIFQFYYRSRMSIKNLNISFQKIFDLLIQNNIIQTDDALHHRFTESDYVTNSVDILNDSNVSPFSNYIGSHKWGVKIV